MPVVSSITLTQNVINSALMNMIISQQIFDSKVASSEIVGQFRVDGTLYGDTKIYQSFDIGSLENWLNDAEAANLLSLNRNKSGKTQVIRMGIYKMMSITTDQYLSKQAFMGEGTFADFTSYLKSSLRKAQQIYERALILNKIGTCSVSTTAANISITSPYDADVETKNRLRAQTLAKEMMVLKTNMEENSREYNSYNYLRSYTPSDFIAFWNVEKHAELLKIDLPTIFHNQIDGEGGFKSYDIAAKWFGTQGSADSALPSSAPSSVAKRISRSGWYQVAGTLTGTFMAEKDKPDADSVYLWAGDPIPYTGQVYNDYARGVQVTVTAQKIKKEDYYDVDTTTDFILIHKDSLPLMSGFNARTEFFNARSLTNTSFLFFGHNNLEFLEEYPRFKVSVTPDNPPSP